MFKAISRLNSLADFDTAPSLLQQMDHSIRWQDERWLVNGTFCGQDDGAQRSQWEAFSHRDRAPMLGGVACRMAKPHEAARGASVSARKTEKNQQLELVGDTWIEHVTPAV